MLEFVVASGKGGVGKSTVSSTLALVLHRELGNVIAIDADADAPNLHLLLGVEKWEKIEPLKDSGKVVYILQDKCTACGECLKACARGAIKVVEGKYVVNELLCEGCGSCMYVCPEKAFRVRFVETGWVRRGMTRYGFPLISASLRVGRPNSGKLVTEEKNWAKELAREGTLLVTDAAAGIGCQVVASLAGANLAILVAEPTPASFSDFKRVYRLARHFMMPSVAVINKYDLNEEYAKEIEEFAEKEGIEVLGEIPYDDRVAKSMALMKPFIEAYPDTETAEKLIQIAMKVKDIYLNWSEWYRAHRPRKPMPYVPKIIRPSKTP